MFNDPASVKIWIQSAKYSKIKIIAQINDTKGKFRQKTLFHKQESNNYFF